jgi:poly-gamma-glutamate synthesis protein (capsule biosynthesis protein)
MRRTSLLLLLILYFNYFLFAQNPDSSKLTIVFAGDIMGHVPQVNAAYDSSTGIYNYEPCFRYIKPFVDSADIAIPNLELTLSGKPYTGYPTFSTPDDLAKYVVGAGFDILAMANNHCYDKGKKGFLRTLSVLDSLKIKHMGTYADSAQREENYPLIIEKNGIRLAFLNYTYGTNGIVVEQPNVVNYINKATIIKDIARADSLKADYKIVILHWGTEYQMKPNKDQVDLAKFLAKHGCNAIIGSHPHVVQTFEILHHDTVDSTNIVPVFYSMGNFVSNQRDRYRDGGAMFSLTLEKDSGKVTAADYCYQPYWVYRGTLAGKFQFYVIPATLPDSSLASLHLPEEAVARLKEFEADTKLQFPNLKESEFFDKPKP